MGDQQVPVPAMVHENVLTHGMRMNEMVWIHDPAHPASLKLGGIPPDRIPLASYKVPQVKRDVCELLVTPQMFRTWAMKGPDPRQSVIISPNVK